MKILRLHTAIPAIAAAVLLAACSEAPVPVTTQPVELRVITSGGFAAAYNVLAPALEERSGVRLVTEYGSSSGGAPTSIPVRLAGGEQFDVVILADYSIDKLINDGFVDGETRRDLALSRIGMSVRTGAEKPDISTPEAFVRVLRDAESFAYSASASGTYLSTDLLPGLGIWEELAPRGKRIVGERVGTVVARGEVEIGFQQVSELLPIDGADFVAPIPDEYQKITVFVAGVTTISSHRQEASILLDYLTSAEAAETVAATGLVPLANR